MKRWLVGSLLIGGIVGTVTAVGVGSWVSATRPYYNVKTIVVSDGDITLNGSANTAGSETNQFTATITEADVGYGGTPPELKWNFYFIKDEQAKHIHWISVVADDATHGHIEWTTGAEVGMYPIWIFVSVHSDYWHAPFTTTLTIS
jgi:hypothetical protein